jgi:hypothetical protein
MSQTPNGNAAEHTASLSPSGPLLPWAKGETKFNVYRNTRAGPWLIFATSLVPGMSQAVWRLRTARRIVDVSERHIAAAPTDRRSVVVLLLKVPPLCGGCPRQCPGRS